MARGSTDWAELGAKQAGNPFTSFIQAVDESIARRRAEDQARKSEEQKLRNVFLELGKKHEYEQELNKQKAEEDRKTEMAKGIEARRTKSYEGGLKRQEREAEAEGTRKLLETFGMGGANVPPGTTFSKGGLTMPLNRELTEGESKAMGQANSLMNQIDEMKGIVESDLALGKKGEPFKASQVKGAFPLALGDVKGQDYQMLRRSILTTITYLRSGAQINDQEFQRFSALLPKARTRDEVDLKQLERFKNEFSEIQGRISSGAKWDKKEKRFVGGETSQTGKAGMVKMISPDDGKTYEFGSSQVQDALDHGWTR